MVAVFTHTPPQLEVPDGHAQVPPLQTSPTPQARPQAPQLAGSLSGSVHTPLQLRSARGQTQLPFRHVSAGLQTWPQAPQLSGSRRSCTQASPQIVRFAPQFGRQRPPGLLQYSPGAHTFPQAPQLLGSLNVLTQAPPQNVVRGSHWHAPETQSWPPPHARPQLPQFATSLKTSTQPLLHATNVPGHEQSPALQA